MEIGAKSQAYELYEKWLVVREYAVLASYVEVPYNTRLTSDSMNAACALSCL